VSKEVLEQLDGFLTRDLGKFRFKGKRKPISVHQLICRMEECNEEQKGFCKSFPLARKILRKQSWDEAIEICQEFKVKYVEVFQNFKWLYGQDGAAEYFINKCEEYKKKSPGESWDGVIVVEDK
jgi:hypothetical protein